MRAWLLALLFVPGCYLSHERATTDAAVPVADAAPVRDAGSDAVVPIGACRLGETRSCYSGAPETDGVGRCHGSVHTCVLGTDGIPAWDQEPPDCVGEVTPSPWGDLLTGDGIGVDDDCDGEVDDFDFFFCGEFGGSITVELYGNTGCCTRAAFPSRTDVPPAGTLIKGSLPAVYYLASDGTRHVFPTTNILSSWYHEPSFPTISRGDDGPVVCPQVVQVPDELLAEIPLSRPNVTFRPGWVTTGITTVPDVRYVVTQGAVLRELRIDILGGGELCSPRVDEHLFIPDFLFGDYTLGSPLTSLGDYDACAEADTTLEEELARRRP